MCTVCRRAVLVSACCPGIDISSILFLQNVLVQMINSFTLKFSGLDRQRRKLRHRRNRITFHDHQAVGGSAGFLPRSLTPDLVVVAASSSAASHLRPRNM